MSNIPRTKNGESGKFKPIERIGSKFGSGVGRKSCSQEELETILCYYAQLYMATRDSEVFNEVTLHIKELMSENNFKYVPLKTSGQREKFLLDTIGDIFGAKFGRIS